MNFLPRTSDGLDDGGDGDYDDDYYYDDDDGDGDDDDGGDGDGDGDDDKLYLRSPRLYGFFILVQTKTQSVILLFKEPP